MYFWDGRALFIFNLVEQRSPFSFVETREERVSFSWSGADIGAGCNQSGLFLKEYKKKPLFYQAEVVGCPLLYSTPS